MTKTKLIPPFGISLETFLSQIKVSLFLAEIDLRHGPFLDPYLVLQYRKTAKGWTSIYHGLTSAAKQPRSWYTLTGPEEGLLMELLAQRAEEAENQES